jgi:hypothetical protein
VSHTTSGNLYVDENKTGQFRHYGLKLLIGAGLLLQDSVLYVVAMLVRCAADRWSSAEARMPNNSGPEGFRTTGLDALLQLEWALIAEQAADG